MVKYLSGRVKRTPQDQLKDDRYQYLNLEQAEPNLADPPTPTNEIPPGSQFQLVSIPGHPGKRYWVPIGGGLIAGAITIFDEGSQVSGTSSITQLNFVGAAVTAEASVQSPSGHPGVAATVTVIPVTVGDNPPIGAGTTNNGELWWESDTGDLYVYYDDGNTSQWVQANAGGRGLAGDKGDKGEPSTQQGPEGDKGSQGQKGEPGNVLAKGVKGEPGVDGNNGNDGSDGDKGNTGDKGAPGVGVKGNQGDKGDKGEVGTQGDKAGILYNFSNANTMVDPNAGNFRFNSSTLSSVSQIAIDALDKNGNDFSDFITTWDDPTNTIKGILSIKSNDNTDTSHTIFQITSITDNTGFLIIGVQNGVGNIPSNLETCVLNFSRTGDKGQKGEVNVAAAGANTQVQFNDNGSFAGAANLQFIKSNTSPELTLKPSDTSTNTNGGSLTVQNANNSNHSQLTSDGALELKRTNETVTTGGPYIDFKNAGTDNDARIEMDITSGQQSNADYSSITFKTGGSGSVSEKFRIGKAGQIGLSGSNYGTTNQVLTSQGSNSAPIWTTQINTQLTTEQVEDIVGDMFSGNTETRISATYIDNASGNGKINLVVDDMTANTTYTLPAGGTNSTSFGTGNATLTLSGSDSSTDIVTITAGSNVKITGTSASGFTISAQDTNDNTQLTSEQVEDIVGAMFSGNTETRISATYVDNGSGSGKINLVADDQSANDNTTYDLSIPNSTTKIRLAGSDSTNDDVEIAAGTGISVTRNNSGKLTIANTDTGSGTGNTKYDLLVPNGTTKIRLDGLTASGNDDDDIEIAGGTGISVTRNNANKLTIANTDTGSGANTTYSISCVDGANTDEERIRLTDSNGGTDDVTLEAGTGLSIARSGDKITFTNSDTGSGANENFYLTALSFNTSNGILSATVNGASNPTVDLDGRYVLSSSYQDGVESGTRMLFQQTSAPTGWTKITSGVNNRALRLVSGTAGTGGNTNFTTAFNSSRSTSSGSVSSHTLTEAQIPSHYHFAFRSGNHGQHQNGSPMSANNYPSSGSGRANLYEGYNIGQSGSVSNVGRTSSVGSGQGHSHGFTNPNFNLDVLYTDVIVAQKD